MRQARRAGVVALTRVSVVPGSELKRGSYEFDYAAAVFGNPNGERLIAPLPPFGTCRVHSGRVSVRHVLGDLFNPSGWTGIKSMNFATGPNAAGAEISLSGHGSVKTLHSEGRRESVYSGVVGGELPLTQFRKLPLFFAPGVYHVASSGGKEIGPFDTIVETMRPIEWTNRGGLSEVARSAGVTVKWKEAGEDDAVLIAAASTDPVTGDSSACLCLAYAKDRRFQIPPLSLSNLPPSGKEDFEPGFLMISELPLQAPAAIHATGLDAGFATFVSINARVVRFR